MHQITYFLLNDLSFFIQGVLAILLSRISLFQWTQSRHVRLVAALVALGATVSTAFWQLMGNASLLFSVIPSLFFMICFGVLVSRMRVDSINPRSEVLILLATNGLIGFLLGFGSPVFALILAFLVASLGWMVKSRFSEPDRALYAMSIDITDVDILPQISDWITELQLDVRHKSVARSAKTQMEIRYWSSPTAHQIFLNRMLTRKGIGEVLCL